ncbi:MAG: hypothetical protein HYV60_22975, partial [Planctomycetia bacterium]|nr:hypothetical protein [Planctomycetia bacterium]
WDETVEIELITRDEYLALHYPTIGASVNPDFPSVYATPGDGVPDGTCSWYCWYGSSGRHYELGSSTSAVVTILDNDAMDGDFNRNLDFESTGELPESFSNGVVDVNARDGSVVVVLPLGDGSPNYRSNDNLPTIIDVELQVPWEQVPTTLAATLTFAGVAGTPITFDASALATYLGPNPGRELRVLVVGPPDLEDYLPTGNYDYDINFEATVNSKQYRRTIRGNTEIVNLVDDTYGTNEFGNRWWLDGLDRLAPGDGITPPANAVKVGTGATETPSASGLAPQGAATENGVALIRGDNTSAWFTAEIVTQGAKIMDDGDYDPNDPANSDVAFSDIYAWTSVGSASSYWWGSASTDYRVSPAGLASEEASVTWKFDELENDQMYQVFTSWTPGAENASNAAYTISNATPVGAELTEKTVVVDQKFTPGEFYHNGRYWRSLGYYVPASDKLQVELNTKNDTDYADGLVVADAVMLIKDWKFTTPDGSFSKLTYGPATWAETSGMWVEPGFAAGEGDFTLFTRHGTRYEFDEHGLEQASEDRNGNRVQFTYADEDSDNHDDELKTITVQGGLTTTYNYAGGALAGAVDFAGRVTSFSNGGGVVTGVTLPSPNDGNPTPSFGFTYSPNGLLASATDARANTTGIGYTSDGFVNVTNADTNIWTVKPLLSDGLTSSQIRKPGSGEIGVRELPLATPPLVQSRAIYLDPRSTLSVPVKVTIQTDDYGLITAEAKPPTRPAAAATTCICRSCIRFMSTIRRTTYAR